MRRAVLAIGLVTSIATGAPGPGPDGVGTTEGQLFVQNSSDEDQVVTIRTLSETVIIDCEVVNQDPGSLITDDVFGWSQAWRLNPGEAVGISSWSGQPCQFALVESDNWVGGPRLVAFDDSFEWTVVSWDDTPRELTLYMTNRGLRDDGELVIPRDLVPDDVDLECDPPPGYERLYWTELTSTANGPADIDVGIDGCVAIEMSDLDDTFYVCLDTELFPFVQGESLTLRPGPASLDIEGELYHLTLDVSGELPLPVDASDLVADCPWVTDACGEVTRTQDFSTPLAGELTDGVQYELDIVHYESRALAVPDCSGLAHLEPSLEWALLTWSE